MMDQKVNAILIHQNDNVVTVTEPLGIESVARYQEGGGIVEIIAKEEIPQFHKIAVIDIPESEPVYKYGQVIGEAITKIKKGSYVHDHNIRSPNTRSQPRGGS